MQIDLFIITELTTLFRHASVCIQSGQVCALIYFAPSDCHEYAPACIPSVQNGNNKLAVSCGAAMKDLNCDLKTDENSKYCMMVRYPQSQD